MSRPQKRMFACFLDYESAFDKVEQKKLLELLKEKYRGQKRKNVINYLN